MKKVKSISQLKEQGIHLNSPEFTWNRKQCNRPLQSDRHWVQKGDSENTEGILREDMNSNADTLRKELENIRRSQEKLENSFAEIQTELKVIKFSMNDAEERISDGEDRIKETTQRW